VAQDELEAMAKMTKSEAYEAAAEYLPGGV
jgi:hypothetical protein